MHQAIELHKDGLSVAEIASELNLSEGRIYQVFRGQNYKLPTFNANRGRTKLWTEDELKFLKANLDKPLAELARQLKRTHQSVKAKLMKLGEHRHYHCIVCECQISQKGRYCTEHNGIERKIAQAKYRSKKRGFEYSLTDEFAIALLQAGCTYCGGDGGGLDRVDSAIAYTTENTVSCCATCNTMKMDRDKDAWLDHMRKILEHQNVG